MSAGACPPLLAPPLSFSFRSWSAARLPEERATCFGAVAIGALLARSLVPPRSHKRPLPRSSQLLLPPPTHPVIGPRLLESCGPAVIPLRRRSRRGRSLEKPAPKSFVPSFGRSSGRSRRSPGGEAGWRCPLPSPPAFLVGRIGKRRSSFSWVCCFLPCPCGQVSE